MQLFKFVSKQVDNSDQYFEIHINGYIFVFFSMMMMITIARLLVAL